MKSAAKPACLIAASVLIVSSAALASAPNYQFSFQNRVGAFASFHVSGPATGDSNRQVQGDAILESVTMPNGEEYRWFYTPVSVYDASYNGRLDKWLVKAGSQCTIGLSDINYTVGAALQDAGENDAEHYQWVSGDDLAGFEQSILSALKSTNLNNYVDNGDSTSRFTFTVEFDLPIKDNDAGGDDFGEILYFERGSGSGNSWIKFQAVDEEGQALGPWLVIGPDETVQTSPQTEISASGQFMGTTAIDVSRLGVDEVQYLRISNDVAGEHAYGGGGDRAPDFKIMAVITHPAHLKLKVAFD